MCRYGFCILLILLQSVFIVDSHAQNRSQLTGKVVNATGVGVPKVTLHILNTGIFLLTNDNGAFRLQALPPGSYQMECTAIGYASQVVEVAHSGEMPPIVLIPAAKQLDAVVVSAEKREVLAQQLPGTLTVLSAARAEQFRIWNTGDLSGLAPNLYLTNSGDDRQVTGIRGVTTTSYTPAVTTYIDGVNQFSLDTYIASLFDIQRIEILRGPQGTLYGRNALGGVINILTKEPANALSGTVELGFGNYGLQRHNASLRSPLIKDKLFMGFSAQWQSRDGYFTNEFNNTSFDRQQSLLSNIYLKYKPGNNWSLIMNVKQQHAQNNGPFPLVQIQGSQQDIYDRPYKLNQNANGQMRDQTSNASLVVKHDGARVSFTSQTAFQSNYRYYRDPLDGDFSPLSIVTISNNYGRDWNRVKVWTQEFRLGSPASYIGPWNWTAGAYLFHQYNPVKQATGFGEDAGYFGADPNTMLINTSQEKANGQALFGQVQYAAGEKWLLTGGMRFDREARDLSVKGDYEMPGVFSFPYRTDTSATVRFSAFSPKLGISYRLTGKNQLYLTVSRGFRAGGLTPLTGDPAQPPLSPYKPEYSTSWEAGSKNSFLNGKWVLNLNLFRTLISDIQVPTLVLPEAVTVIRNTGDLVSKGVELEGSVLPARNLSVDYAFGLTHATYGSFKVPVIENDVPMEKDYKGNRQLFTPDKTILIAAQYAIGLNKKGNAQLWLRGEWKHTGKVYFDVANTIIQDPYDVFNTRIGAAIGDLEFAVWGRNVFGAKYIGYAYDFGAVHLGNPATWGVSVKKRF